VDRLGLGLDRIGQLEDVVLGRLFISRFGFRRGRGGGLGLRRRVIFGDDAPDGGEDLLHRRFL
jgi:hypothetical protein